jgi:hypothetical protein
MKPILATMIAMTSLMTGAASPVVADDLPFPKAKRIELPLPGTDGDGPARPVFCIRKQSKSIIIHILRCRTEGDMSCSLLGERQLQDLSPAARILKVSPLPDGCLQLILRGVVK